MVLSIQSSVLRTALLYPASSAGSPVFAVRSFQVSSRVSRKARSASAAPQGDDDDDLFADTGSSPTSADTSDHSARRQEVLQKISTISSLPNREKKREASSFRVGSLRKMVQLCDKPEELDELRRALRGWRVMGMRVTPKTAEEIAGRCCSLKRPELAVELLEDRLQYGLPPLSTMMMIRLRSSLLSSASTSTSQIPKLPNNQHISPSLALVHLAVLHRLSPDSSTVDVDAESQMMAGRLKVVGSSETTVTAAANRQKWSGRLKRAGGVWAEAGKMVMESEVVKELERRAATSSSPTIASD